MSARTGIDATELDVLREIARAGGAERPIPITALRTDVLPNDTFTQTLQTMGKWWRAFPPLLKLEGNWGGIDDDHLYEIDSLDVAIGTIGKLALEAEDGTTGPVPLGLMRGSLSSAWMPFGSSALLDTCKALSVDPNLSESRIEVMAGDPIVPTAGHVEGDFNLYRQGQAVELLVSPNVEQSGDPIHTELRGLPWGVSANRLVVEIATAVNARRNSESAKSGSLIVDLQDRTTETTGANVRLVTASPSASLAELTRWLRSIPSFTTNQLWQLPAPLVPTLRELAHMVRREPQGLRTLGQILPMVPRAFAAR